MNGIMIGAVNDKTYTYLHDEVRCDQLLLLAHIALISNVLRTKAFLPIAIFVSSTIEL
jgi:hypothetical protein